MNVNALLSQVACGFNREPLVWCSVDTIEDSTQYGIFDMSEESQCTGQLKIYTAMNNALQIFKLRTGRIYRNLKGLKNIYRITADGNCCWQIHPRRSLRGLGRQINFGYDNIPPFQIISLKSISCWYLIVIIVINGALLIAFSSHIKPYLTLSQNYLMLSNWSYQNHKALQMYLWLPYSFWPREFWTLHLFGSWMCSVHLLKLISNV